jgi:hypothetical protein
VAKEQKDDAVSGSENRPDGYNYVEIPMLQVIWPPLPQSGRAQPENARQILVMEGGDGIIEIVLESI